MAGHLKGALPKTAAERLALIDRLAEVQRSRRLLADEEAWLQSALGYAWRGERTAFAEVLDAALWLGKIRSAGVFAKAADLPRAMAAVIDPATTALGLNDRLHEAETRMTAPLKLLGFDPAQIGLGAVRQANMADMQRGLMRMRDEILRHSEWTQLKRAMLALTNAGAECIVQAVSAELLEPARASAEFAYACAEARWTAARKSRPKLDDIAAHDRHAIVDRFRGLERDRLKDAQTLILAKHYAQVPKGHAGEMAVIRGEIARKKGHKPIRWVNCCMQLVRLGQGGLIFGRNARVADQRHQNHPSAI